MPEETTHEAPVETKVYNNLPPINSEFIRNPFGLLENKNYIFKEDGFVNWRAMIPAEHVLLNREYFLKKSTPIDVNTLSEEDYADRLSKADEKDKIIKLAGLKEVAKIRGYISIIVENIPVREENRAVVRVEIKWIGNYESSFEYDISSALGEATEENTNGLARKYLVSIAENRAVARAIRNYLMIHTVSQEEVRLENLDDFGDNKNTDSTTGPQTVIKIKLKEKKEGFAAFQEWVVENREELDIVGAETWEDTSDIPAAVAVSLLSKLAVFFKRQVGVATVTKTVKNK